MRFVRRIRRLLGLKDADFSSTFPDGIQTTTRGLLRIVRSSLLVGESVALVFCRYETVEAENETNASFHPEQLEPPDSDKWVKVFDRRYADVASSWRTLLLGQTSRMSKRLGGWLPAESSVEDLVRSLALSRILISQDESVTVRFVTSPLLKHHDLGVTLDRRNRVVSIEIDG